MVSLGLSASPVLSHDLSYVTSFFVMFSVLRSEVDELITNSVSGSTLAVYEHNKQKYRQFCRDMGMEATGRQCGESVELYMAHLCRQGLAYSTIQSHLSAVRHLFRTLGAPLCFDTDRLKLLLQGIKRQASRPRNSKFAVTPSHLLRLRDAAAGMGGVSALRFRAMIGCAFYGFLRPSEYCVTARSHHLRVKDVRFAKDGRSCCFTFRSFKHSKVPAVVRMSDLPGEPLRPVTVLQRYIAVSGRKGCEALFDVSAQEFSNLLARMCHMARIKTKLTPHSFRHGGATWAVKQGWTVTQIQTHGRWRSNAYLRYINPY